MSRTLRSYYDDTSFTAPSAALDRDCDRYSSQQLTHTTYDLDPSLYLKSTRPAGRYVLASLDHYRNVPWLIKIRKIIADSVDDRVVPELNDGSTISSSIAENALNFFDVLGSKLPLSEPYMYASLSGHLVCEFRISDEKLIIEIQSKAFIASKTNSENIFVDELTVDASDQRTLRKRFESYING